MERFQFSIGENQVVVAFNICLVQFHIPGGKFGLSPVQLTTLIQNVSWLGAACSTKDDTDDQNWRGTRVTSFLQSARYLYVTTCVVSPSVHLLTNSNICCYVYLFFIFYYTLHT